MKTIDDPRHHEVLFEFIFGSKVKALKKALIKSVTGLYNSRILLLKISSRHRKLSDEDIEDLKEAMSKIEELEQVVGNIKKDYENLPIFSKLRDRIGRSK